MSLEAIQLIAEAEERARKMKSDCAAAAKKRVADARAAGEAALAQAEKKADAELEAMFAETAENAKKNAHEQYEKNQISRAQMRESAEAKMPEAVSFIVERIVSS